MLQHFIKTQKNMTFDFLKEALKKFGYRTTASVYVHPEHHQGIGTRLIVEMEKYFKEDLGCKEIRLIYASDNGRRIYQRKGFRQCNWICLDADDIQQYKDPVIRS